MMTTGCLTTRRCFRKTKLIGKPVYSAQRGSFFFDLGYQRLHMSLVFFRFNVVQKKLQTMGKLSERLRVCRTGRLWVNDSHHSPASSPSTK